MPSRPDSSTRGGYASREYAQSFGEWGEVLPLAGSGGHLLMRPVAGSAQRDAGGCYPIFSCVRWSELASDLKHLPADLVSLTLVTDPFCPLAEGELRQMFRIVRLLGEHYLVDLTNPAARSPSRHHRRKLRDTAPEIEIAIVEHPPALLDDWIGLYETLSQKRGIRGLRRFSRAIFAAQLAAPGTVVFTARLDGRLLGADWYFQDEDRVFAHLSAYAEEGYERSVSYPMMAAAIEHFSTGASVLNLGGAPSVSASNRDGVAAFKAGWSTRTLPSYLCGIDLVPDEYRRLGDGQPPSEIEFFPHYRRGEY
jgi:hypothetical protein